MVGSLMGLIVSQRFDMVKAVYPDEVQKSEEESKQAPDTALSINEHAVKDIS